VSDVEIRFRGDNRSAVGASRDLRGELGRLDSSGRSVGSRLGSAFGSLARRAVIGIGAASAAFVGMAIFKGGQRAVAIDDAEKKLEGLGYTTEQVAQIMDTALKAVLGTPYSLAQALTVASTAMAAGVRPGQELSKYLALVADTATIAGISLEDAGSILNKATANVKIHADVLNQLADRGLPVFSWLQKEYRVTGDELSSMVRRGEVDADTLLKVIRDNIGGAAQKAGESIRGSFSNLITAVARLGDALVGPVFGSLPGFFNAIRGQLDRLALAIQPIGEALGETFERLQAAKGWKARVDIVFTGVRGAVGNLIDAIQEALFGGTQFKAIKLPTGRLIEIERTETQGLVNKLGDALARVDWSRAARGIASALATALRTTARLGDSLATVIFDAIGRIPWVDVGKTVGPGLAAALATAFVTLLDPGFWIDNWQLMLVAAVSALGLIFTPVKIGWVVARPLLSGFKFAFLVLFKWIPQGIAAVARELFAGLAGPGGRAAARGAQRIVERIISYVRTIPARVGRYIEITAFAIANAARGWVGAGARAVARLISAIVDRLNPLGGRVGAKIAGVAGAIIRAGVSLYHAAAEVGRLIVSGIIAGLGSLFSAVANKITSSVRGAINWAKGNLGSTAEEYAATQLGGPLARGVAAGFEAEGRRLADSFSAALRGSVRRVRVPSVGALGGAGVAPVAGGGVVVNVSVGPVYGSMTQRDAERLAVGLAPAIRRELRASIVSHT
jgi:tape measure domain-containing protein